MPIFLFFYSSSPLCCYLVTPLTIPVQQHIVSNLFSKFTLAVSHISMCISFTLIRVIVQKKGSTENSATFIFGNENHTLGNPLRHIVMQQRETSFCGYSVPHPYEPKMNMRIQSQGTTAVKVLKKSLEDMETMCDLLDTEFDAALARFKPQ